MSSSSIRYARTSDGVSIAWATRGSGPSLFWPQPLLSATPLQAWLNSPLFQDYFGGWERDFTSSTYDPRGFGLSDPWDRPLTRETLVGDASAVVDALGGPGFMYTGGNGEFSGVPLAAIRPELFQGIVLSSPAPDGSRYLTRLGPLLALAESNIDAFVDFSFRQAARFSDDAGFSEWSRIVRSAITPEFVASRVELVRDWDLRPDYARIQCPVTILLTEEATGDVRADAREIAGILPNATIRVLPGAPSMDRPTTALVREVIFEAIDAVSPAAVAPTADEPSPASSFRTILFTDVVSSTPLLAQLKDEKMREVMRDHDRIMQSAVEANGGHVIKTIGDAFMAEFAAPSAALLAAIQMQQNIRDHFDGTDVPVRIRVGINAGEPVAEEGDLHGLSVVIAKRLESAAEDGGILVSDVVRQAVAGKPFEFDDRGPLDLKGIPEPVRAWGLRLG